MIGQLDRLPERLRSVILDLQERLSKNTGLNLTFAVSYGSQDEIVSAMKDFAVDCVETGKDPKSLTVESAYSYLWTRDLGDLADVDLMIRTSGESRVSNFLLWQSAYAEFAFTKTCWPDFQPMHMSSIVDDYLSRDRRFGGVSSVRSSQKNPGLEASL